MYTHQSLESPDSHNAAIARIRRDSTRDMFPQQRQTMSSFADSEVDDDEASQHPYTRPVAAAGSVDASPRSPRSAGLQRAVETEPRKSVANTSLHL